MKPVLVLVCAALLSACASNYTKTLSLDLDTSQVAAYYHDKPRVQFTSQDLRTANYLVSFKNKDKAAGLINNDQNLRLITAENLKTKLQQQGLELVDSSDKQFRLDILTLRTSVTQSRVKYQADSSIRLKVIVKNQDRQLAKLYKSHSSWEGAFSPSLEEIEQDLEEQLNTLLTEIITDPQIQTYLNN